MPAIGIIGHGRLGRALERALERVGHAVTCADTSGGHAAAVQGSDLVILAVPFSSLETALADTGSLDGRVVWSCVNALKPDYSGLAIGFDTSAAERVATLAPGARLVSALPPFAHTIAGGALDYDGRRPTVFLCGDDAGAKSVVGGLVADIGADPVDAGALQSARLVEPAMMLVVALAFGAQPPRDVALALLERS